MLVKDMIISVLFNSKNAERSIDNFKSKVITAGKIITGAVSAKYIFDSAKSLAEFAEAWDLPVEKANHFVNVISQIGGKFEDAKGDMTALQNALNEYVMTKGGGPLQSVLPNLGLNILDETGHVKNAFDFIEELREKLQSHPVRVRIKVAEQLGIKNQAILRYLKKTNEEMQELNVKAVKMGGLRKEGADAVLEAYQAWTKLRQSIINAGYEVLNSYAPAIRYIGKALTKLSDLINSINPHIAVLVTVGVALSTIGGALKTVLVLLTKIGGATAIGTLAKGIMSLLGPLALVSVKLGAIIALIAAVGYGAYKLYEWTGKDTEEDKKYKEAYGRDDVDSRALYDTPEFMHMRGMDVAKPVEKPATNNVANNNSKVIKNTFNMNLPNVTEPREFLKVISRINDQNARGIA